MRYRMRTYEVVPEHLDAFTQFFVTDLLPVQQRHGARLVGRWATDAGDRVVALWEYDSEEERRRIDDAVRADPASVAIANRGEGVRFFHHREDTLLTSTVPLDRTLLGNSALERR